MRARIRPKLLGIVLGAVALVIGLALTLPPREPTYKGLTADQWDALGAAPGRYREREEAWLVLGTNNLRLFVQRLAYDPNKDKLVSLYSRLPGGLKKQAWLRERISRKNMRAATGLGLLSQLGPKAAPELPHFLQIAKEAGTIPAMRAIIVLRSIGEPACPALISLVGHQDAMVATSALRSLGRYTNSLAVRQALTNALHDPRAVVSWTARDALAGELSN